MLPQIPESVRYHGLDSLRAAMMLLGVVLHGAVGYAAADFKIWPIHDAQTTPLLDGVIVLIHAFRMPVFFLIAGFFAALLIDKRGVSAFMRNRRARILKPLLVFWALLLVPTCWGLWIAMREIGAINPDLPLAHLTIYVAVKATWLHLWFLYHLLWLYAAGLLLRRTPLQAPDELFRRFLQSPLKALLLGGLTALLLLPMESGSIDTSATLIPDPFVLLVHSLFFGVGWMLYRSRDLLTTCSEGAWANLAAAAVIFPFNLQFLRALAGEPADASGAERLGAVLTSGLLAGLLTFAVTGLFLRYLDGYSRVARYLTDGSYWMYLIHLPLLVWMTVWMLDEPWPALGKFAIGQAAVIPILLLSYHYLVRSTAIGAMLNGRRYPRSLPPARLEKLPVGGPANARRPA